jgi:hypothetical protein
MANGPSRCPERGENRRGECRLPNDKQYAASIAAAPEAHCLTHRHEDGAGEIEDSSDAYTGKTDSHDQCPFS